MEIKNVIPLMVGKFTFYVKSVFINKNDERGEWEWFKRKNNTKAVVVVAKYGDKLVITKEFRIPIENYEWGLPAGLIDEGETPEQAARRELKEETGLDINKIYCISPEIYSSSGITNEAVQVVFCEAEGTPSIENNESDEDITVYLMSQADVLELLGRGDIAIGAKAYFVMKQFVNYGTV